MSVRSILLLALIALVGCNRDAGKEEHSHGSEPNAEEAERGPHGGRLLRRGDIAVELAIFEDGVPPEFRAWAYRDGKQLPPADASIEVVLERLGGVRDVHELAPRSDHLVGSAEVYEPHSFEVALTARVGKDSASWKWSSHEGRTRIAKEIAKEAGIRVEPAGPGTIRDEHDVQGLLTPIEGRHARIVARFPGPIRAMSVKVGDQVRAGQALATVESNVSLSNYVVAAPIAGTVLARHASVGELAGDAPLFEIADLSRVWVDLHLFGGDAQHIRPGLPVVVTRLSDGVATETKLDSVLPSTATASQSTVARASVDNVDGNWRPGAAVRARVTVAAHDVALAVPLSALQRFRDWDVVFIRVGDEYEARPLELGRRDGVAVEVLAGLRPGAEVVVEQSYLVKADIEKSGASHDH